MICDTHGKGWVLDTGQTYQNGVVGNAGNAETKGAAMTTSVVGVRCQSLEIDYSIEVLEL